MTHVRNLDHARGLLRNLQTTKTQRMREGYDPIETEAFYGPKIAALQAQIKELTEAGAIRTTYQRGKDSQRNSSHGKVGKMRRNSFEEDW